MNSNCDVTICKYRHWVRFFSVTQEEYERERIRSMRFGHTPAQLAGGAVLLMAECDGDNY
jgi:hypothetical protein